MRKVARTSLALAASVFAFAAVAQQRPDFGKVEIKTTRLADDFYVLEGQGGAISVLTGPEGVLLVDSQFAALTDKASERFVKWLYAEVKAAKTKTAAR